MLKDATVPPGDNEEKAGRGGLTDYNRLGYVSTDFVRAGNRTLEYAYNDYCLAVVAKGIKRRGEYWRFIQQANNWQNLWRDIEDRGTRGFIMPRDAHGNWVDSIQCNENMEGLLMYHIHRSCRIGPFASAGGAVSSMRPIRGNTLCRYPTTWQNWLHSPEAEKLF
jgi:Putative alpha-1,2-mannosidase